MPRNRLAKTVVLGLLRLRRIVCRGGRSDHPSQAEQSMSQQINRRHWSCDAAHNCVAHPVVAISFCRRHSRFGAGRSS